MKKPVHIILNCTNRKRTAGHAVPRIRDINGGVDDRAGAWMAVLDQVPPIAEAKDVYAGEYWRTATDLVGKAANGFAVSLWVLSAGLGFISGHDKIPPYSATFALGQADSVVTAASGSGGRRNWWARLSRWRGPSPEDQPRSLKALASAQPDAGILLCAGPDYLDAVYPDLLDAQRALTYPSQLVICTSHAPVPPLVESWVQIPGRLRTLLGGSMASTGPRAAGVALESHPADSRLDADTIRRAVNELIAASAELPRFDRRVLDDRAVRDWIAQHVATTPGATKSGCLNAYRSAGFACEQARFGRLFAEVERQDR